MPARTPWLGVQAVAPGSPGVGHDPHHPQLSDPRIPQICGGFQRMIGSGFLVREPTGRHRRNLVVEARLLDILSGYSDAELLAQDTSRRECDQIYRRMCGTLGPRLV